MGLSLKDYTGWDFQNVAVGRINKVAALTGFSSDVKTYGRFSGKNILAVLALVLRVVNPHCRGWVHRNEGPLSGLEYTFLSGFSPKWFVSGGFRIPAMNHLVNQSINQSINLLSIGKYNFQEFQ